MVVRTTAKSTQLHFQRKVGRLFATKMSFQLHLQPLCCNFCQPSFMITVTTLDVQVPILPLSCNQFGTVRLEVSAGSCRSHTAVAFLRCRILYVRIDSYGNIVIAICYLSLIWNMFVFHFSKRKLNSKTHSCQTFKKREKWSKVKEYPWNLLEVCSIL